MRWEKQVSKKFVLIREINKDDLRPSQSPICPTNIWDSLFTFIVRVTVLTVQTIVPHPHVCPSLPIAKLNAEINRKLKLFQFCVAMTVRDSYDTKTKIIKCHGLVLQLT